MFLNNSIFFNAAFNIWICQRFLWDPYNVNISNVIILKDDHFNIQYSSVFSQYGRVGGWGASTTRRRAASSLYFRRLLYPGYYEPTWLHHHKQTSWRSAAECSQELDEQN